MTRNDGTGTTTKAPLGRWVEAAAEPARHAGIDDPRAVPILAAEHWGLLSARNLGYQEMFGRATIFIAIVSGTIIALALVAQATRFGRETLLVALLLMSVALFIGLATFVRCVAINLEDARWVDGLNQLRRAYLDIVPELRPYFVSARDAEAGRDPLAHGAPQRGLGMARSLTTTSSVVAALNSVLVGSLVSDVASLAGMPLLVVATLGGAISIVSGVLHARYAARFRARHSVNARGAAER